MNQLVISNNGVQQSWQYFNIYIPTVKYKDRLKEFGKWNKNLKTGAGWIFPKSKKEKVYEILKI